MSKFNLYEHEGMGFLKTQPGVGPLKQRFDMAPFSVWNSRDGDWQARKQVWKNRGIKSEEGRKKKLTFNIPDRFRDGTKIRKCKSDTSIFDPVVCELVYSWFCKPEGVILDPFAGGSVRGLVASMMGRKYIGIELSAEQIEANEKQLTSSTVGQYKPKWKCGDSFKLMPSAPECDLLFSCPPYGNLERYSKDPDDISNMTYDEFLERYRAIIKMGVDKLRDNRFACYVVANYRSREPGRQMLDLVGDTIRAFEECGAMFYNDIVLVNAAGTAPMRATNIFVRGGRKMVKSHQNVLVFVKGDAKVAASEIPLEEEKN